MMVMRGDRRKDSTHANEWHSSFVDGLAILPGIGLENECWEH